MLNASLFLTLFLAPWPVGSQPSSPVASSGTASLRAMCRCEDYPTEFDWGTIEVTDTAVELNVTAIPSDRKISIPRFYNTYERVYLKAAPDRDGPELRPGVSDWVITLPVSDRAREVVVIETVGQPQLTQAPAVCEQDEAGDLLLPAHQATVHGELLRFEPQPHKNTIGYWANVDDWCDWKVQIDRPGRFDVFVLQGCGEGHGGSEVQITLGQSQLEMIVEDTGHFQNFKDREVGQLVVETAGEYTLEIRATRKAKIAVMDVRQLRLVRLDEPQTDSDESP